MTEPSPHRAGGPLRLLALAGGLVVFLWLAVQAIHFSLEKHYSIDEFQYGHGAWLISEGKVPYRDFFEHHFPLVHQVMAAVFLAAGDDPGNLLLLRVAMLPFVAAILFAAAFVNRRATDRVTAWVTPIVVLGTSAFLVLGTEVRPDTIAFSFFLGAIAVLYSSRLGAAARAFLSGLLFTVSAWGTQKVLYYGLVFVAAYLADLVGLRRRRRDEGAGEPRPLLAHVPAFTLGAMAVLIVLGLYLTVTGSWGDWFYWCLQWSFVHQLHYPGFNWFQNFLPFAALHLWLLVFGGIGVRWSWRRLGDPGAVPEAARGGELILLGALATTLASNVWQSAAYLYSLIPFMTLLGIFAARGLVASYRYLAGLAAARRAAGVFGIALVTLLLAGELVRVRTLLGNDLQQTNERQHAMLRTLGELTAPGDPVFDIAGRQVTRPSIHFFYFADAVVRTLLAETLEREIPPAVLSSGCAVYLHQHRFTKMAPSLQQFLVDNFQPYDEEIWLWGRRYRNESGTGLASDFHAVREGRYFLWVAESPGDWSLVIDGRPVASPVFDLARGAHEFTYTGAAPEIYLLWLPRNGQPWRPVPLTPQQIYFGQVPGPPPPAIPAED